MKRKSDSRITKAALARATGVSRGSVLKYLEGDDAPKPDRTGRFDAIAAAFYVGQALARATEPSAVVGMRERKLALELAALERTDRKARGELLERSAIEPGIAAFQTWWTAQLQAVFEFELPMKYSGLDVQERRKLNELAVDRLLVGMKKGLAKAATDAEVTAYRATNHV